MPRSAWASPRARAGVAALGVWLLLPGALLAQSDPCDDRVSAVECCQVLLFPIGARAVALGNALTAGAGADAIFANPAGLALLARDEFRIHNAETEIEVSNTFGVGLRIRGAGVLGLTYRLVDYGEIDATDPVTGMPTGQIRLLDHALVATFAATMAPGLVAGVSYKLFQFRMDCSGFCGEAGFSATTHGADLGVQYRPARLRALQLGASMVHFGLPLQVINAEQASPMPARLRLGAAYEVMHHFSADSTTALWTSLDVSGSWRDGVPVTVSGGAELALDETIFVRTGYATGSGRNAGASVGIGLRYERFDLGIAKSFISAETGAQDPFQITFAIAF